MRKSHKLKVRCYAARLIDINEYLSVLPGVKAGNNISETELNEILLSSISNGSSKQAYDCETINLEIC